MTIEMWEYHLEYHYPVNAIPQQGIVVASPNSATQVAVGVLASVAFCVEIMAQHTAAMSWRVVCSSR